MTAWLNRTLRATLEIPSKSNSRRRGGTVSPYALCTLAAAKPADRYVICDDQRVSPLPIPRFGCICTLVSHSRLCVERDGRRGGDTRTDPFDTPIRKL